MLKYIQFSRVSNLDSRGEVLNMCSSIYNPLGVSTLELRGEVPGGARRLLTSGGQNTKVLP